MQEESKSRVADDKAEEYRTVGEVERSSSENKYFKDYASHF